MFWKTSHLSKIIEDSKIKPIIIFKYSSTCKTSEVLKEKIEKSNIPYPIYILTVQNMPVLSKNIENVLSIKHESPQIIILSKGSVIYFASHQNIKIENLAKT